MGTRGSVAWVEPDGSWKGVYNHYDSYPDSLGEDVWKRCKELGIEGVVKRLKTVGDWREFEGGGVCAYCGKVAGQPHDMSAVMSGFGAEGRAAFIAMRSGQAGGRQDLTTSYEREIATLDEVENNKKTAGVPDPEAKWHSHGDGPKDQFDPRKDPLFMEWVYLLQPGQDVIEVWTFVKATDRNRSLPWTGKTKEKYTHVLTGTLRMSEPEPDWGKFSLECRSRRQHGGEQEA